MVIPREDHWTAELGGLVAKVRKQDRLSHRELAERSGVSMVTISKIERALPRRTYPHETIRKIEPVLLDNLPRTPSLRIADGHATDDDGSFAVVTGKHLPIDRQSFGIVVRGESLASLGIHDGDLVWVTRFEVIGPVSTTSQFIVPTS